MKNKTIKSYALVLSIILILGMANISLFVMASDIISGDFTTIENSDEEIVISDEEIAIKDQIASSTEISLISDNDISQFISRSDVETYEHVARLHDMEDLNTIVLKNKDGSITAYIFSENIKYIDQTGKIYDKQAKLTDSIDTDVYKSNYAYTNTGNDVRVYFPNTLGNSKGILLGKDDINIELIPIPSTTLSLETETMALDNTAIETFTAQKKEIAVQNESSESKEVIEYANVFGNSTSIRYAPTLNGFKEDIIITAYTGVNEFNFRLKTNGLKVVNENGIYYLVNPETSEKMVNIGELIVYSNNGTVRCSNYSHQFNIQAIKENNEYLLNIVIDKDFLTDENTEYPVIIDPSFEVISTNGNILDISVRANGTVYANSVNNGVGHHNVLLEDMRTFIQFPGLLNNPLFQELAPPGYGSSTIPEVQSIKLKMYSRGTSALDTDVTVYPYSAASSVAWTYNTSSFTSAQFNALGNEWSSTTTVPLTANVWVEFDITNVCMYGADKGIVLVNEFEGSDNDPAYQSFASTKDANYKPMITVTWQGDDNSSFDTAIDSALNTEYTVTVGTSNTQKYYSFTPTTTGFYTLESFDNGSCDPIVWLYNSSQVLLGNDDDSAGSRNYKIVYHLTSGQQYFIKSGCYGTGTGSYKICISPSNDLSGVKTSTVNTSATSTANVSASYKRIYLKFTPSLSCLYSVTSTSTSGNPYGWLYNSSGQLLSSNDNGGEGNNFQIRYPLSSGETYYIVAGCYGSLTNNYTVSISAIPPLPPTDLTVSNITADTLRLDWSVGSPHFADRWLIQRRVNGGSWENWTTTTTKYFNVSGLIASTSYEFRIFSESGSTKWNGIWSEASNTVSVTTLPEQPINVSVSSKTGNSVTLTWNTASPHGADRWLIEYMVGTDPWQQAGTSTSPSFTVNGLSASTVYAFRVYSESGNVEWEGTRSVVSETVRTTTLPAQPTNVTVNTKTGNSVTLTWNTASPHGADRWLIEYMVGTDPWQQAGTSTSPSFTVNGLSASTVYAFRVYSESGNVEWEGTRSVVSETVRTKTRPAQPTDLTVSNISSNSVTFTWNTASPHGASRWLVQYRIPGNSWVDFGTVTSKSCTVTGLSPNTDYEFRVYGVSDPTDMWQGEYSIVSNTLSATTRYIKVHPIGLTSGSQGTTYAGHQSTARDFGAAQGTPIYATMAGIITNVVMIHENNAFLEQDGTMNEYGNYIDIQVEDGTLIRYAHQQKTSLPGIYIGATVYAGQQIGEVGATGYTSPAPTFHLHFEIFGNGNVDDYYLWN